MVSEPAMGRMKKARDINAKVSEFVSLVNEVGPDIPLIAKRMGEHRESVRYWFKKVLKDGILIQPTVNFERLGLVRVIVVADFTGDFASQAETILIALGKLCYVQSFVKTLPEEHYIVKATVPFEAVNPWIEMMRKLGDSGVFKSLDFSVYDSARNAPMKSSMFDFEEGKWDYAWSAQSKVYPEAIEGPSPKTAVDQIDLEIIKRLQRDETKPLSEIQKETGINYKTLSFHHRKHVLGKQMLRGHRVNWLGTTRNPANDRSKHRRHTYQPIDVLVKDITTVERATLMGMMNALPFLWYEASGRSCYYAQLVFPTENISEALQYLARALLPVRDRARWFMVDQSHSLVMTVEPALFDSETKAWRFNQSEVLAKVDQVLLRIKSGP